MTKNSKPILSILIDEGKRARFADLARRNSLSMSYLVNQAIDRMLDTDSIDSSVGTSIVTSVSSNYVDSSVVGMTGTDIEQLVKSYIGSIDIEQLVKSYVDNQSSSVVPIDIEQLVKSYVDNQSSSVVPIDIEQLVKSYVDSQSSSVVSIDEVNRLISKSSDELLELLRSDIPTIENIKAEIEHSIAPLTDRLEELETYTQPKTGEPISFTQLAKDLGYTIPDGVKASAPRKEGADGLIAFAVTLGQFFLWDGKKQKFYKAEIVD